MLQLVYLGTTSEIVRYEPDEADLLATERKVDALWEAIELAKATGEFLPSRGKQCDWCAFKAHCPAWGGELLPMPAPPSRWARLKRTARRGGGGGQAAAGTVRAPRGVAERRRRDVTKPLRYVRCRVAGAEILGSTTDRRVAS